MFIFNDKSHSMYLIKTNQFVVVQLENFGYFQRNVFQNSIRHYKNKEKNHSAINKLTIYWIQKLIPKIDGKIDVVYMYCLNNNFKSA